MVTSYLYRYIASKYNRIELPAATKRREYMFLILIIPLHISDSSSILKPDLVLFCSLHVTLKTEDYWMCYLDQYCVIMFGVC